MKRKPEQPAGSGRAPFAEPIAIVGVGGVFPGARNLEQFWDIVARGVDTSRAVPPGRWVLDPDSIRHPVPGTPDRVYTDRGCFVENFKLDPSGLNLPPGLAESLDPACQILLQAGRDAFASARTDSIDRNRVGIVLGNIALPTESSSAWCAEILTPLLLNKALGHPVERSPLKVNPLNRYVAGLPAGVLAQALGLGGGTATLDAACASSLYALKLACDELLAGRTDAMLAGGLSRPDSLYTQMGFSQLRALATTGRCAPFDESGSGLIVGEGAGVVVLKRLSDALRDEDDIHALIRGIGVSNDLDGNLLSPSSEGQLRALKLAYAQAGWTPDMVDFIECHATGTPVGDAVEFASLSQLWQGSGWRPGQCVLGAVKANVGHLLTAAGSASLIKLLLALKHDTLPPTANFQRPADKIPLAASPFKILQQGEPWQRRDESTPRRAAINGFGFGGVNAHVLIEEWTGQKEQRPRSRAKSSRPTTGNHGHAGVPVAIVGLATRIGPWSTLPAFQERVFGGANEKPASRAEWRGIEADSMQSALGQSGHSLPGYYLDDLAIPVDRYRIPPKELGELLPQQALMLEVAREALADAQLQPVDPSRAGVFIGLGLDLRTTDFHFRWSMLKQAEQLAERHLPEASEAGKAAWIQQLVESASPPLTADRTMGALAGTNASRIAKEFHFGGQSYTVCSEDCSGIRALEIAVRALQQGEVDQAFAGAVDLTGDVRALLATDLIQPYSRTGVPCPFDINADGAVPGEGAVGVVLKRLDDARRDGDRIYSIIRGVGVASGEIGGHSDVSASYALALERAYQDAGVQPGSVGYVEAHGNGHPEQDEKEAKALAAFFDEAKRTTARRISSVSADVGHTGAASGLVSIARASLALYREVLPPLRGLRQPLEALSSAQGFAPLCAPQHWVRNRSEGPRRAGVSTLSVDGNATHVVLEACEDQPGKRHASEQARPPGPLSEGLFSFQAETLAGLLMELARLQDIAGESSSQPVESLARRWSKSLFKKALEPRPLAFGVPPSGGFCALPPEGGTPNRSFTLGIVAQSVPQLLRLLDVASEAVTEAKHPVADGIDRDRVFYSPQRLAGGIAFVFPGAGSHFAGMGRELALNWPAVVRAQDRENDALASQMFVDQFWNSTITTSMGTDHRAAICAQVALGAFVSDLARYFGIKPDAAIGYSLGESTSLFALRAWTARDDMLRRVTASSLFQHDLTGAPDMLRRVWNLPPDQPVEWKAGLVDRPAAAVREAMTGRQRVYILIVNTPDECVIGGDAPEVKAVVAKLGCHWFPLEGVSTVHCELLRPVAQAYRELHLFDTTPPGGVKFFSGGWGRAYVPDRETAADAIVAQAGGCIDFPRVVRAAYDSGIRIFLEMGPGNSCTRMIGRILADEPHVARSLCPSAKEPVLDLVRALAELVAEGVGVDLGKVYAGTDAPGQGVDNASRQETKCVRIAITGPAMNPPSLPPAPKTIPAEHRSPVAPATLRQAASVSANGTHSETPAVLMDSFEAELLGSMAVSQAETIKAHQAYLDFSQNLFHTLSQSVATQFELLGAIQSGSAVQVTQPERGISATKGQADPTPARKPVLDREACLEFAVGSVAKVLGEEFRDADSFPTRVRLPDEPLMLVDRILEIHGEARSLTHGRVVTEHDIHEGAWYLDCGRIPTCIAVEAGQADLFLSGYLGIDFKTRGLAVYRLLDARVCFHRSLPGPGEVIHYDIRIERFFRQSDTWLFRFNFEATVAGEPLLTMTDGCAGFFSAEALAGGKGIVRTPTDLKPARGKRPADWEPFVEMGVESYTAQQLDALRAGDLSACFGPQFASLALNAPVTLPDGRMKLVHRITRLEPDGGRFGLGLIRGEADIQASDWFLTCHFVDDRVMPGTLMYECCLHTLRVFLLRMGWVVEHGAGVALEPVPGVVGQLKCRGQVLETTQTVTYEIEIKEIGYGPEPYVVADSLMYADGKPIVEIGNMSLRYTGVTRETLRKTWQEVQRLGAGRSATGSVSAHPKKPAIFGPETILAFSNGKPSEAFGAPYRIFDEQRRIARLPGPPYQFLDRITDIRGCEAFQMVAGGEVEAEYDVPPEAWYFAANRQPDMPFAVLLEIALQPCGWLSAYLGSALTSADDLSYRNLGGTGIQFVPVRPEVGTLTTRVKNTRLSSSAGMIIQWFEFEVWTGSLKVYAGDTYFGFFPKAALLKQEGIKGAALYQPTAAELARARSLAYPHAAPFAGDQLRMVDDITAFVPDGGPAGFGFIRATKRVMAGEWFFKAHFYQDPVVPGSLGLESFLQLLKFLAVERWGHSEGTRWEAVATNQKQEWTYRGQIIPADHLVTIEAVVTAVDHAGRLLRADGFLSVDGRVIYAMKDFTVRAVRD